MAAPKPRAGVEREQAAKVAMARRAKRSALPDHLTLVLTLDLRRAQAERSSANAIREGRAWALQHTGRALAEQWPNEQEKQLGKGGALMVPPIWLDESGQPRPVRQCSRCGDGAPLYRFRPEHLRMTGWCLYAPTEHVNWCGHGQEFVPLQDEDGWCRLVPVIGEET